MRETRVRFLGWEDPLEKEMAIHSSTPAWKISWMEEPDRLQSMGSQRVGHNWATSLHFMCKSIIVPILHGRKWRDKEMLLCIIYLFCITTHTGGLTNTLFICSWFSGLVFLAWRAGQFFASLTWAFQVALVVNNPPANAGNARDGFDPWVGKIPWSRKWQPTPLFLPGESHG